MTDKSNHHDQIINPYKFMLLKFQPHRVYGWEVEVTSILQVVAVQEPTSYAIYGIRAIGKTTLLKYLKHKSGAMRRYNQSLDDAFRTNRRRLVWVYVNCHHLFDDVNVLYVMFSHLLEELRQQRLATNIMPEPPNRDDDDRDTVDHLRDFLKLLKDSEKVHVVFLLDDFDIPLLSGQIKIEDDYLLRTVSDEAALVIATDEPISELRPDLTPEASPLLGILKPERIGLISEKSAERLIREPAHMDAQIQYLDEEVEMLLEIGGCLPYLLIITCEKYFDMRQGILDLETTFSNVALKQGIRTQLMNTLLFEPGVNSVLSLIWTKRKELQPILIEMAKAENHVFTGVQATKVEHYSLAYQATAKDGTTGFRIFSALFAEFVRREANVPLSPNGHYDSSLLKIINSLPPVDRGVLEYLASREGQVCTFEELLESVWEDGTGTKRALEAAVHRLRRTVPTGHDIRNVRGAGYKYVIAETV